MNNTKMRIEKKNNLREVDGVGRVRVETGRCTIVTMEDGHLSGSGKDFDMALAALRRNIALGGVKPKGGRDAR